jgi:hypothetical protein
LALQQAIKEKTAVNTHDRRRPAEPACKLAKAQPLSREPDNAPVPLFLIDQADLALPFQDVTTGLPFIARQEAVKGLALRMICG